MAIGSDYVASLQASGSTSTATTTSSTSVTSTSSSSTSTNSSSSTNDFRLRIGYLDSGPTYTGILSPLTNTNGVMFPYTPSIQVSRSVDYTSMDMTHANQDYYAFRKSPNVNISINAKFTVQNQVEGLYTLAAIHFFRSVSLMYFGETDANSGNAGVPPPVLQLNGYGTYMYNKIRCIVKDFSFSYDETMDLIKVQASNGTVYLPPLMSMSLSAIVQNTSRAQRKDFSLDQYRSGALMEKAPNNSGWI